MQLRKELQGGVAPLVYVEEIIKGNVGGYLYEVKIVFI
jgi:hypothetical protein